MAKSANNNKLEFGQRLVTVHQFTLADIRAYMAELGEETSPELDEAGDPLDVLLFEDCSLHDLVRMSDLDYTELDGLTQDQLTELRDRCRALNPLFFAYRERLGHLGRALMRQLREQRQQQRRLALERELTDLDRNVSALIRAGHVNAWAYNWQQYSAAIDELREAAEHRRGR